jgi:hypothetical protein
VTYNGKSFDVPVVETRFMYHRRTAVLSGMPHIDMVHPARRLWRGRTRQLSLDDTTSCRLAMLERALIGVSRWGDVGGAEIPLRYFDFIRYGRVASLIPVLEHNRLDLLSLAGLTSLACRLIDRGPAGSDDAAECLGLGRLFEQNGAADRAGPCFERVAELAAAAPGWCEAGIVTEAMRRLAVTRRRERRHEDAARLWARLLDEPEVPRGLHPEAAEALAIHHEHRTRDLFTAKEYARRAYEMRQGTTPVRESLTRRLTRLDRKIERWGGVPRKLDFAIS